MDLSINNVTKSFSIYEVLNGVSFHINKGEKIGIVGPNGCGKTTLFKIIKGIEKPDSGEVFIKKDLKIGYLDQIPEYNVTVREVLYQAFTDILAKKNELTKLEKEMLDKPNDQRLLKKYGHTQEHFTDIGGYEIETEFNKIVKGLKIPNELLEKNFQILSGGEKSRVVLGKILLERPDILLLDEPSNHLDLKSIAWLEGYLQKYEGSVVIISHDRYLLDRVTNKIIDVENGKAKVYHGNYSYFVKEKAKYMQELWKTYTSQQRKIKKMEEQIERFRIWGRMRDSEKMFKKAKTIEKRLDKIEKMDKPTTSKSIKLHFDNIGRTGKEVIKVTNYSKSFETPLLNNVDFTVRYGDRAFLIGENGAGKSTLFRSILGETDYEGEIKITSKAEIGVLSQEIIYSNPNKTIIQEFRDSNPMHEGEARKKLAKFLFYGDDVFKAVGDISGGEKSRLELCKMVNSDTNILLLDEPTNHLDIESKEMLEHSLVEYPGTLLVISHDRYFINKLSSYILCIENTDIVRYDGDYDKYFEKQEEKKKKVKKKRVKIKTSKKVTRNFEQELEDIEKIIEEYDFKIKSELENVNVDYDKIQKYVNKKEELEQDYLDIIEEMK